MTDSASSTKPEGTKAVDTEDETPEYQEMIMFYISNVIRASLTLWCLAIISLAYIKLPPRMFGMDIPEQRIDATYSAGLLGNLLASYGISIGGMSKKKKNGQGENGNGISSDGKQTQTIRIEQPLIIKTEPPIATKV
tara:strand:- start:90 stop:500 length:411 start_codon:yes stop_codon:yes gene_type:complete